MGLLSLGTPLDWHKARQLGEHVRKHGIEQFLAVWRELRGRHGDELLWGDELEYMVVKFHDEAKSAHVSLRQGEILQKLSQCDQSELQGSKCTVMPTFHPEFGRYMIESTPGAPFTVAASDLLRVESDMRLRRQIARRHLNADEVPMTIGSFPRLGVTDAPFTDPPYEAKGEASHSMFLPDEIINTHVRFPTLAANIRQRRGSKVRINVPLFKDTQTPSPFIDPTIPWDRRLFPEDVEAKLGAAYPDHIYMDAMGFGMGCCCLQVTFQLPSIDEARRMYDQLVPFTPLLLAATASTPVFRGYLADVDARWNIISASVDDRTPAERGEAPLKPNEPTHNSDLPVRRIRKSRYDSVDSYLFDEHDRPSARAYNDLDLERNAQVEQHLQAEGVDPLLAEHLAHLFIRDPIVIFSENIDLDNATSVDHFENLQSTNWQTMRFKPPPHGGHIGWRVEFRPMEIQVTDYENAAFTVFLVLLTRVLTSCPVNFYMPLSLVDENMQRAQKRDAIHTQRFHFRRNTQAEPRRTTARSEEADASLSSSVMTLGEADTAEYTLAELFHGTDTMPGFLPLIHNYLDTLSLDASTRTQLNDYLDLVAARVDGRLLTAASYIRQFVQSHPSYRHDSVVSDEINYDLLRTLDKIERGELDAPGFLPASYAARRRAAGI
ncbi:glutamate-cysteine ligase catalytic subunit [Malassezia pachydermatis]|uniref:Glutamate--cysteine ligase n=1 Tax=Malassezia pachydermatis TaxID=77020 RepID=A0A0M9VQ68_9BASI|nr:glutamate-cysteine ligase catalytic subunit [Malassezia pachydermatis]KOS15212.1 glutamate-cysteine ligase catalytic subunit [Malassezia pachydermatis]